MPGDLWRIGHSVKEVLVAVNNVHQRCDSQGILRIKYGYGAVKTRRNIATIQTESRYQSLTIHNHSTTHQCASENVKLISQEKQGAALQNRRPALYVQQL